MHLDGMKRMRLGAPATLSAPRRTPLGQALLDARQRRLLVLLDGRRDPYVLGLILDDVPIVDELCKLVAQGWVEWEAAPAWLRQAA